MNIQKFYFDGREFIFDVDPIQLAQKIDNLSQAQTDKAMPIQQGTKNLIHFQMQSSPCLQIPSTEGLFVAAQNQAKQKSSSIFQLEEFKGQKYFQEQGFSSPDVPSSEEPFIAARSSTKQESNFISEQEDTKKLTGSKNKANKVNKSNAVIYYAKHRHSPKKQAKCQRLISVIKECHIDKNIPPSIFRRVKKSMKKTLINPQLIYKIKSNTRMNELLQKRSLNHQDLTQFVRNSGMRQKQWKIILNIKQIQSQIQKNKKIGSPTKYVGKYQPYKQFLIMMDKDILKIIYPSVLRTILRILNGEDFQGYLDEEAQIQLRSLDLSYERSVEFSQSFLNLCSMIQQQESDQINSNFQQQQMNYYQ